MQKEVLSDKQAVCVIILFLSGTSSASLFGIAAGKDVWLAIILSVLGALISGIIIARIHYTFPDKNLFEVLEICFGKFPGKLLGILLAAYTLQASIDVLSNMSFFIQTVTMPETPRTATIIIIMSLCLWVVKEGVEVLGRWSEFFIPMFVIALFIAVMLLIPRMDLNNIRPVLYGGITPVLKGAFFTFTFPFGEIVVFSLIFSSFRTRKSPYKVYTISLLLAGGLVLIISLTDILVLGVDLSLALYYPSYSAVSKIAMGEFLERLEITSALAMILGGFVKVSIYLMASCKGIANIFKYKDYRFLVAPLVLLIISTSTFFHKNILDYTEWNNGTWPYLALLFQVIIPVIVLGLCEVRRVLKKI